MSGITMMAGEDSESTSGLPLAIKGTAGMAHVMSATQTPGVVVSRETLDQTTTVTSQAFASGVLAVEIGYFNLGSAVGKILYVCFDALDTADAATRLGAAGGRESVMLGESRTFNFDSRTACYRLDYASDAASETGDSLVRVTAKVAA